VQAAQQTDLIRAAGALLWQGPPGRRLVAVVHRKRYDDDWTLPKGKLKIDESWHQAAIREVREETGYNARILSFAGAVSYEVDGCPKIVRYWHMVAQGEPSPKRDDEVAELVWLPVEQAIKRLQYPLDKCLVEEATPPDPFPSDQPQRQKRWFLDTLSISRLAIALEIFEAELEVIFEKSPVGDSQSYAGWYARAKQLLNAAKRAQGDGDSERGWRCLKAADRVSLYGLDSASLTGEARAILSEATDEEKISSRWRRASILQLLSDGKGQVKTCLGPGGVARAKRILDEQQDNVYHKLDILRLRLKLLTITAVVAVAIWIAWPPLSPVLTATGQIVTGTDPGRRMWLAIILTGILGALVSGFSSSMTRDQKTVRIPAERLATTVTFARISLAMLSSLAISIFLTSGLLNLPGPSLGLLLAVAFASGFSDRLLMRALDSITV